MGLLGGSWVVISRVTILRIMLTTTHEPPSRALGFRVRD